VVGFNVARFARRPFYYIFSCNCREDGINGVGVFPKAEDIYKISDLVKGIVYN